MSVRKKIWLFTCMVSIAVCFILHHLSKNEVFAAEERSGAHSTYIYDEKLEAIYQKTTTDLLKQDSWLPNTVQHASVVLMLPMYYAFQQGHSEVMKEFDCFFDNYTAYYDQNCLPDLTRLVKMQFLYLASQYLTLQMDYCGDYNKRLYDIVLYNAKQDLNGEATWKTEFSVKEHLKKVLEHKIYEKSYYSWIVDSDFFTLAILCDLKSIAMKRNLPITEEMNFSSDFVVALLNDPELNTETEDDCWLFQVGVMKDHKDFLYAGNQVLTSNMTTSIREDITWDSAHLRRMPLWLRSFDAAQTSTEAQTIIKKRITQLSNLFAYRILKQENGYWLTSTFADGTNGIFRYNYHGDGKAETGYVHSGGTIFLGYWVMLNNSLIRNIYRDIFNICLRNQFRYPNTDINRETLTTSIYCICNIRTE